MTAYEFLTEYRPSMMALVKCMDYKLPEIAEKIKKTDPELFLTDDYRETMDVYIDETHSYDSVDDAVSWMVSTARHAIRYGLDTKNLDWKVKFIVAWDIAHNLTKKEGKWVA